MSAVLNKSEIKLGSYVCDSYQRIGRVTDIHFGCPESAGWIAGQSKPVSAEEVKGVWASILVHGGGSVVEPVTRLAKIPAFALDNNWADEYFEVA